MLGYWAATVALYLLCFGLVFDEIRTGRLDRGFGFAVIAFGVACLTFFYVLIRRSPSMGIPHWQLAWAQGFAAVATELLLYAAIRTSHGAILIGMPVVIAFLTFALRPRQTFALAAFAVGGLAATSATIHILDPVAFPARTEVVNVMLASIGVIAASFITRDLQVLRQRMRSQADDLMAALARIELLATTDELTALSNRRHMHELLDQEERRQASQFHPTSIALIDIDHFKQINDRFGHDGGDAALRALAAEARRSLRGDDTLARWGGEEFLLLMPGTTRPDAVAVVERMLAGVRELPLDGFGEPFRLTFSAGVIECQPGERFADAVRRSDKAMYEAKARGRDIVVAA